MKVECSQQYVSITPSGTPWSVMLGHGDCDDDQDEKGGGDDGDHDQDEVLSSPTPVMFMARIMNGTADDQDDVAVVMVILGMVNMIFIEIMTISPQQCSQSGRPSTYR